MQTDRVPDGRHTNGHITMELPHKVRDTNMTVMRSAGISNSILKRIMDLFLSGCGILIFFLFLFRQETEAAPWLHSFAEFIRALPAVFSGIFTLIGNPLTVLQVGPVPFLWNPAVASLIQSRESEEPVGEE